LKKEEEWIVQLLLSEHLDAKVAEIAYLKKLIENRGHRAVVIDVGIIGEPAFEPTINHYQVSEAA